MQKLPSILRAAPLAALVLLAACDSKPETVTGGVSDPTANEVANAPKVTLPPALLSSHTYRCKDNSLIYVDFFDDKLTADLKMKKDGEATKLTAPEAGKPYEGGGHKITGNGSTITYDGQSCKA
jgi:hypothetical protein